MKPYNLVLISVLLITLVALSSQTHASALSSDGVSQHQLKPGPREAPSNIQANIQNDMLSISYESGKSKITNLLIDLYSRSYVFASERNTLSGELKIASVSRLSALNRKNSSLSASGASRGACTAVGTVSLGGPNYAYLTQWACPNGELIIELGSSLGSAFFSSPVLIGAFE